MKLRFPLLMVLPLVSSMALAGTTFNQADMNDDGKVTRTEFRSTVGDADFAADWDDDDDGRIDTMEYEAIGLEDEFDEWDRDTNDYLSDNELYDGVYSSYDEDENGHWDGDEWDDAGDDGWFDI
ncbi:hypothetical protein [Bowmanella dokdonensis]|uniref:EF-hand domain-containing protein n=1 Tax=Bowmanella dokdonensis TaxID=751969 RepID=A0A939ISV7_9ALTE|nr:hypothetical protein [Bowmanella dokdonensis]MBN7826831.1 hypothetical protein [Bowmanella dokdonensis]